MLNQVWRYIKIKQQQASNKNSFHRNEYLSLKDKYTKSSINLKLKISYEYLGSNKKLFH